MDGELKARICISISACDDFGTTAAPKHVMPYLAHNEVDYKPIGKTPATLVPDSRDRSDGSEKIRELATLLVNTSAL